MTKHFIHFATIAILTSCTSDFIIQEEPQLVVEGWIESGGYPNVIVTTSIPISKEHKNTEEVMDCMVKWAKVTVSDGEREVILTGFADKNIMPPYIYRSAEMKGEPGKTYTLDVEYKDFHATATTTIPEAVPIKSIRQNKVNASDDKYTLTLSFDDPEPKGNYYKIFSSRANERQFLSTYLGVLSDDILNREVNVEIYPGHTLKDIEDYDLFYTKGSEVEVRLCTIDETSYTFWKEYGDVLSFGRNFLLPYTKTITSNMNGAYGYWCGYGTSSRILTIGSSVNEK